MCLSQKPMRGPFLSNGPLVMGPVADSEEALEVLGQRHADHGSAGLANLARLRRAGPPACQRSCFRLPGEAGHVDAGGVRATLAVQLYWNGDEPMTLGFADGDLRGKLDTLVEETLEQVCESSLAVLQPNAPAPKG
jgi:hypothetical protein